MTERLESLRAEAPNLNQQLDEFETLQVQGLGYSLSMVRKLLEQAIKWREAAQTEEEMACYINATGALQALQGPAAKFMEHGDEVEELFRETLRPKGRSE
jgi:hypothetical protein